MSRKRYNYLPPHLERERYQLWDTYRKLGLPRDADRVAKCPGTLREYRDPKRLPCHDRLCPHCTWRSGLRNFYRLDKLLKASRNPYFVTLKVPPQTYRAHHLLEAWTKIRRCAWFKEFVRGGCRFIEMLEVTRGTGVLSPHLHLIIDLNQDIWGEGGISLLEFEDLLINEWQKHLPYSNGNRFIACNQIDNTSPDERKRVLKYPFKAPKIHGSPAMVVQFWEEMRGVHRASPFGNWVKKRTPKRATTVYYYKNATEAEPAPAAPDTPPPPEKYPKSARWSVGWEELRQNLRE